MEDAIIIYPNSKEDSNLYKQLAKRLNNRIELKAKVKEEVSNDPFFKDPKNIKLIKEGLADMKAGRVTEIKDINNIWDTIL